MACPKEPSNDYRIPLTWIHKGNKTWRGTEKRENRKAGWKKWSEVQTAAADRAG